MSTNINITARNTSHLHSAIIPTEIILDACVLQCPSRITSWPGAQLRGTRSYPDAVLHFARVHPLMARAVLPSHGAPVWHSAGPPECRFTSFTVDLVEAADGVYDVIFLGTGQLGARCSNMSDAQNNWKSIKF